MSSYSTQANSRRPNRKKSATDRKGVSALRDFLARLAASKSWPILSAVPPTRELGERFEVSNVSAFRVLGELRDRGLFWQATNGRYYLPAARRLMEKPLPVACLFRRLQSWTEVSREILQGADDECGATDRALLLVHDRALFHQANPTSRATSASREMLTESLDDFLQLHGERTSGVLLDELWPDDVLAEFADRLSCAVVLYRRTLLPFLGSVTADTSSAAELVLELAAHRNDGEILMVSPVSEYLPSSEMAASIKRASTRRGIPCADPFDFGPSLHQYLAAILGKKKSSLLIVATEDNTAVGVLSILRQAGWRDPARVGLVSTMGSRIALEAGITATKFDFQDMGRQAVQATTEPAPARINIKPSMVCAKTT